MSEKEASTPATHGAPIIAELQAWADTLDLEAASYAWAGVVRDRLKKIIARHKSSTPTLRPSSVDDGWPKCEPDPALQRAVDLLVEGERSDGTTLTREQCAAVATWLSVVGLPWTEYESKLQRCREPNGALSPACGGLCVLPAGHRSGCYSPAYVRDSIDAEAEYETLCRVVAENKWGGYPKWVREQFVTTVPTGREDSK